MRVVLVNIKYINTGNVFLRDIVSRCEKKNLMVDYFENRKILFVISRLI